MVQEAERGVQVIQERILTAQSHQISYVDNNQKPLEFEVSDYVFLKVLSTYIRHFEVLRHISIIAYHLVLLPNLSNVHPVFHVFILKKYVLDPLHVIRYDEVQLQDELSYKEQPLVILDRQVKQLCSKDIVIMKLLWQSHSIEEATWELKKKM
ncbi:uncharacterized protein LOC110413400 [Herrania umbratica]|uniref:Uncharacterized protein LOC110413400 n=1 Tax=Herrania umbratica TaxID=108875 RepID=A0A6J0ZZU0_9ROSI|nr:uncharacterized protein LOC110413400 [Herrania umbratica]